MMSKVSMRRPLRYALALSAAAILTGLAGCTSSPDDAPSGPASGSASPSVVAPKGTAGEPGPSSTVSNALVINISLRDGKVSPNGKKIEVRNGQSVTLNVSSDHDDEVHVHGDYNIELAVSSNKPATRTFVADKPGSVEIESHEPSKIIAIMNVR